MNPRCLLLAWILMFAGSAVATDWSGMGGPLGNHSAVDPNLPADWTGVAGKVAWRFPLTGATLTKAPGQIAIASERVYIVDRNRDNTQAVLRVLNLKDGHEAWSFAWPIVGEPKATEERPFGAPAVSRDHVFLSGPEDSTLRAVDLKTHAQTWTANLPKLGFLSSGCASPMVVEDAVVLIARTAGKDTHDVLLAFDQAKGTLRWSCAMPKRKGFRTRIQNAPQVVTLHGVRQIVVHHQSGVAGVSLAGKLLWDWDGYRKGTLTATPSVSPNGYIFVCSGHTGSRALGHITRKNEEWRCETIFSDPSDSRLHGFFGQGHAYTTGAAWWDGAFYMAAPEGLQCMLPDGSIAWRDRCMVGKDKSSAVATGLASVTVVNGRLLTLTSAGDLLVAAAEPKGYRELARIKTAAPSRAILAYSAGRIVIFSARNSEVVCVDLGAKQ